LDLGVNSPELDGAEADESRKDDRREDSTEQGGVEPALDADGLVGRRRGFEAFGVEPHFAAIEPDLDR
jgi:hypothetical protein